MQRIDWDQSYFVLRSVYNEAIRKLNCDEGNIGIISVDDGQYRASLDVSVEPFRFVGARAPTIVAAKAKLLFTVIKHVNKVLGYSIIDVNYPVRQHQERYMQFFNNKMHGIWRCGQRMQRLIRSSEQQLSLNKVVLNAFAGQHGCTRVVADCVNTFVSKLDTAKHSFDGLWFQFLNCKVLQCVVDLLFLNCISTFSCVM